MSWQAYIDTLIQSGGITRAAIVGIPNGEVWAMSPDFNVSTPEIQAIITGFQQQGSLQSGGVRVNGQKYFYITSDDTQIQAKQGNCGCSIARGKSCLIIGTYGEGQQPGTARLAVENMAQYLKESGY